MTRESRVANVTLVYQMKLRPLLSGLRVRSILVLSLAILPTLAAYFGVAGDWRAHEASDSRADALRVARHAAALHDRMMQGAADVLSGLANAPALLQSDQPQSFGEIFAVVRERSGYGDLGVAAPDGTILYSAAGRQDPGGARAVLRRSAELRRLVVGRYELDRRMEGGAATLAQPVADRDGNVRRVLFVVLDLGWLSGLAERERLPEGTTVTVFDGRGTVIAREPNAAAFVGRSIREHPVLSGLLARGAQDTAAGTMADGRPGLFGYAPFGGMAAEAGLHIAVAVPAAAATAHADQILARDLIGFSLALLLALGIAWFGSDLLFVRRLKVLVQTTRRLSGGDLAARTGLPYGAGELDHLARAFDEMAATLQQRQDVIRQQTERLSEQERRFRAMIENSSDGIVLLGSDGAVKYASPSTARILGHHVDDLVGRLSFDFIHPEDRCAAREKLAAVVQAPGIVHNMDLRVQQGDGSWRWIGVVARNLLEEPSVRAIIANYRDITEQRQAQESLRAAHHEMELRVLDRTAQLRETNAVLEAEINDRKRVEETLRKLSSAIEQTADKVLVTDFNGVIEYANPAAEWLTGFSREELVGSTANFLNAGKQDASFFENLRSRILAGGVFRAVFTNKTKDGRVYFEDQTITPVKNAAGEITHFVATGRDITRRRRAEEALRRLNDQLEHEAERIAQVLHDEAGQFLTAAHITLADVARGLAPSERSRL
ncbi:MAG: PAS domain S-box protein, partial [Acidobacteria bacterium]